MDYGLIVMSGIRGLMRSNVDLVTLVSDRIWFQHAPDQGVLPYVLVRPMWGGADNRTARRAFDVWWQIFGVSDQQSEAADVANALASALLAQTPMFPDPFVPVGPITYIYPLSLTEEIQGQQYYGIGGVYRIRGEETL